MQKTLLFYDLETSGLNKCFDQPLQFAAIRTDLNLNEIERVNIDIRLNCDVIPNPHAILTHGIGLERIEQGQPEIQAIQTIHQWLNTPGTISLGYNTLGFDDEFLRFSFYRNLLPPYTHQFANGCGRMDIYPMTVLYYLFKPDLLKWPMIDGQVSLKLENLNACNQLAEGRAHDAMVDVEVTVALAKQLQRDKTMWLYVSDYFDKKIDLQRNNELPIIHENEQELIREGLMVLGKLGAKQQFIAPVISLGQHRHYKNQTLWLRLDCEELTQATVKNFLDHTWVIRKKMGEQALLLPPQPRFLEKVSADRQQIANDNKQRLLKDPRLLKTISNHYCEYQYPDVPHLDIDAALYTMGFPSQEEEKLFRQFHQAAAEEKYDIAQRFPNPKRREQAFRLLTRHYPEHIPDNERIACLEGMKNPDAQDYQGQTRLSAEAALTECEQLTQSSLSTAQQQLIDSLRLWLHSMIKKAKPSHVPLG